MTTTTQGPAPVQLVQPRTTDITTAAQMLGIGRATAYRLIERGEFPVRVLKLGSRRLISLADLDRYLNGGEAA